MEDNFLEIRELQAEEALQIIQPPTEVTIAVDSISVAEDDSKTLKYTFTRTDDDISNALTVNFTVSGTATFNTDYQQAGAEEFTTTQGKISIAAGETTATVNITPIADAEIESDETVKLSLAIGSNYIFDADSVMATSAIANNDPMLNVDWAKQFGISDGSYRRFALDDRANTYATGWFRSQVTFGNQTLTPKGDYDDFVTKFDKDGNVEWAKNFGGNTFENTDDIAVDDDGNTYITGTFRDAITFGDITLEGGESGNVFVTKLDGKGDTLWAKKFSNDKLSNYDSDISTDNKGNTYITGRFEDTITFGNTTLESSEGRDIFVTKLDSKGDVLWAKDLGSDNGDERANDIVLDAEGNAYIAGRFEDTVTFGNTTLEGGESGDAFVAKLDSNGDVLWAKDFDGERGGYDDATSITLDSEGNAYITGAFRELNESGDVFVAKLDSEGDVQWEEVFDTNKNRNIVAKGITVDDTGNSYVTGYHFGESISVGNFMLYTQNDKSSSGNDAFIAKLDSEGEVKWAQNIGGNNPETISDIDINDGKIYIAGDFYQEAAFGDKTFTTQKNFDSFLIKLEETKLESQKEKALVTLSVNSNTITEGDNNQITYTFNRTGDTSVELTVDFTVTGSATFNEDYSLTGAEEFDGSKGKVTFKAEEATANVILNITDDATVEQDETVALSIAVGSDYTVSTTDVAANTITITSEDKEPIIDETPDIPIGNDKDEENKDIPIDDNDSEKPDIPIGDDDNDDDEGELSFTSNGKSTFKFKSKIKGGKSSIKFSFKSKNIEEIKEIGFVTVDDDEGTIDGISPDAEGYIEAALKRAQTIFSVLGNAPQGFDSTSLEKIIEFSSDKSFRFLSVKEGTLDGAKKGKINLSQVAFSSEVSELEKNDFDLDFGGVKIKMQLDGKAKKAIGSGLQDTIEVLDLREVTSKQTATFTVNREAEFDNVIGFYKVTDENGGIDTDGDGTADILVGDAGYAQAAVQNRIASIDLSVENQSTATFEGEFEAGSIFVPFLIVDGTTDVFDEIFFSFLDANSDSADHVMMLGDNIFGFEDLAGGGDRDFNDTIVKVDFNSVTT